MNVSKDTAREKIPRLFKWQLRYGAREEGENKSAVARAGDFQSLPPYWLEERVVLEKGFFPSAAVARRMACPPVASVPVLVHAERGKGHSNLPPPTQLHFA